MMVACDYCGKPFSRRQGWQTLCRDCYKLRQNYGGKDGWLFAMDLELECQRLRLELAAQKLDPSEQRLLAHLRGNPKAWLALVHPDRHGGSVVADEVTRLVLDVRKSRGGIKP